MRDLVRRNLPAKLAALALAMLAWLKFAGQSDLAGMLTAPVHYRHFPAGLETSTPVSEAVQVEVRGSAGELRDLTGKVSAVIDLASVTAPGERTFSIGAAELDLPGGLTLVRSVPAQIRLTFEKRATRRVKVEVPFSGPLDPGLTIDRIEVDPPQLEIVGPASKVEAARNPVSDPLDLTTVVDGAEYRLAVFNSEPEVRFVGAAAVRVKVHASRKR